jgi:hypothetical protein
VRPIPTLILALALNAGLSGLAMADQPGSDWMPIDQVRKALMAEGYTEISKLEADDGHWDGEGIKNGRKMKFDADPKTGAILGEVAD